MLLVSFLEIFTDADSGLEKNGDEQLSGWKAELLKLCCVAKSKEDSQKTPEKQLLFSTLRLRCLFDADEIPTAFGGSITQCANITDIYQRSHPKT